MQEYKQAIERVKSGKGGSWDYCLAERAANSHNFPLQKEAKDALGWK